MGSLNFKEVGQPIRIDFNEDISLSTPTLVLEPQLGTRKDITDDVTIPSVTVVITIDNGTQTASGGTAPAHEGNGYHSYTPTQGETNGDHLAFTFTGTGAIPTTIQTFTQFPQTVDNDTKISLIPTTAMRGTDSAATSAKQDTMETTLNAIPTTAMRGTDSANTVTPLDAAGTRSALGLASANMDTQFSASVTATGFATPTNITAASGIVLAGVTHTDAVIPTVSVNSDMRGTDGANTTTPPTASAISSAVWSEGIRTITAFTFEVNCDVQKINGVTITGDGSATPFNV